MLKIKKALHNKAHKYSEFFHIYSRARQIKDCNNLPVIEILIDHNSTWIRKGNLVLTNSQEYA